MIVNNRFGGVCPKCRPKHRAGQTQETEGRPLPEGMPSWHEIGTTQIHTKAYVPKGAKHLWGQCVASALIQILCHGDDRAWREWYMLPKAVLRSSDRGGGKNARGKAESETKARAKAWLEGKRRGLWEPQKFKGTGHK